MNEIFYVTTPIYYVNDVPHIGHSYTTIAADVLARYHRAEGRAVRFLTGTDEHGIKIVKAAAEKGTTPGQLADEVVVHFQQLWRDLNISHDDFIRTSQPRHERRVQEIIRRLLAKDEIYLGEYKGWYDEGQEEFVTESTARAQEYKSAITGKPLTQFTEPSYFFRLKKWVAPLRDYITSQPDFIQPGARRNEVLSKLDQGVEDLSISRARAKLNWGVAMPNDDSHVVYVWVDALSNYITALGYPPVGDPDDEKQWAFWPASVQLIGKDILWFHTVYWPCILMALGEQPPRTIFAHGWWTSEGRKQSKSLGNFVSREVIAEICQEYTRDFFRYFVLREVPFGADGDFSRASLKLRYNVELANGVGNLLSRTCNMIGRYFDGKVPQAGTAPPEAAPVRAAAEDLVASAPALMEACQFHQYLEKVLALAGATDKFIEVTEPFKLAKVPDQRERLGSILYACAESVRIVLSYLAPFMPEKTAEGLAQLGLPAAGPEPLTQRGQWGRLAAGTALAKGGPLFMRKP